MVWYDRDIREKGVQTLDALFQDPPFSVREDANGRHDVDYARPDGTSVEILSYGKGEIILYHGLIDKLPLTIKKQVKEKLQSLDFLEGLEGRV